MARHGEARIPWRVGSWDLDTFFDMFARILSTAIYSGLDYDRVLQHDCVAWQRFIEQSNSFLVLVLASKSNMRKPTHTVRHERAPIIRRVGPCELTVSSRPHSIIVKRVGVPRPWGKPQRLAADVIGSWC